MRTRQKLRQSISLVTSHCCPTKAPVWGEVQSGDSREEILSSCLSSMFCLCRHHWHSLAAPRSELTSSLYCHAVNTSPCPTAGQDRNSLYSLSHQPLSLSVAPGTLKFIFLAQNIYGGIEGINKKSPKQTNQPQAMQTDPSLPCWQFGGVLTVAHRWHLSHSQVSTNEALLHFQ